MDKIVHLKMDKEVFVIFLTKKLILLKIVYSKVKKCQYNHSHEQSKFVCFNRLENRPGAKIHACINITHENLIL
jgi:hypothetical protein